MSNYTRTKITKDFFLQSPVDSLKIIFFPTCWGLTLATLLPAVVTDETPSGPEGVLSENPEGPTDEAEDAPSMLELTAAATDADTETVGPPDTNALGSPLAPPVGKNRLGKKELLSASTDGFVLNPLGVMSQFFPSSK